MANKHKYAEYGSAPSRCTAAARSPLAVGILWAHAEEEAGRCLSKQLSHMYDKSYRLSEMLKTATNYNNFTALWAFGHTSCSHLAAPHRSRHKQREREREKVLIKLWGKSNKFTEAFYDLFNASATHAIRYDAAQAAGDQKFSMKSLRAAASLIMRKDACRQTCEMKMSRSARDSCLGLAWIKRLY